MPRIMVSMDDIAPAARPDAWQNLLSKFALRLDGIESPNRISGRVEHVFRPLGFGFSVMEAGPQRLASAAEWDGDDMYFLSLIAEGQARVEIDGELVDIGPGHLLWGKRGAVGAVEMHSPFRFLNINIPTAMIARASPIALPSHLVHLRGEAPSTRILAAMLGEIARSVGSLEGGRHAAIEGALLQLLVCSIFEESGRNPLGGFASTRAAVLRQIWQTIEDRLQDNGLSLAEIAAVHRLSPRYIQQLFQESGHSFRAYLRQRRLERCRQALCDPTNVHISLTELCLTWGFSDSANFSRTFREAYGCPPSDMRREALSELLDRKRRLHRVDAHLS